MFQTLGLVHGGTLKGGAFKGTNWPVWKQLYYGTPTYIKTLPFSLGGRIVD